MQGDLVSKNRNFFLLFLFLKQGLMQAGFQFTPASTSWCVVLQMKPRASHCTISAPTPEPLGRYLLRKERHKGQQKRGKLLNCYKHYICLMQKNTFMYLLTKPGTVDVLLQLLSKFVFKMCISVCMWSACMPGPEFRRRYLEWELTHHLGTRNQMQVLFESSKYSQLLSHLSCPPPLLFCFVLF